MKFNSRRPILEWPLFGLLTVFLVAPVNLWHHHEVCEARSLNSSHCALCHHQSLPIMAADFVPLPSEEAATFALDVHPPLQPPIVGFEIHSIRGPPAV